MAKVGWSIAAANDLLLIRRYITEFNPDAANTVSLRLRSTAASLTDFPDRGRQGPLGT
ncbi:type II toxin-antitoxin system RelE/ParE family toxin [uncultured Sphingomonas sp.]|uniref:type II toxin-antitoxin system RelE/ParE family toxin n=1 Tax=uncultured Sphingomonas sp. TaxID=158754 RepID=UPI00345AB5D3